MAITINGNPIGTTVMPVWNPIEYDISSNNTAQSNFKYVVDIYAAGATSPIRKKQPPDPTNGYCVFDIASVVKDYMGRNAWGYTDTVFNDCSSSYNNFTVKFGEEYGASSAITVYPDLTTDSSRFAINGAFSHPEYVAIAYKNYTLGTVARKFLTSRSTIDVTTTDKYQLYFLNGNTTGTTVYNIVCKSYNSSGTLLQTLEFGTPFSTNNKMQRVCVGPEQLNAMTGGELRYSITTAQPFVSASVSYYTVEAVESGLGKISETKRFNVVEDCNTHTTYTLMFQNKFGGYDSFAFKSASDKKEMLMRTEYKRRLGAWSGTSYNYDYTDRGRAVQNTFVQDGLHLRSDWLTENESAWLSELISSGDVYILDTASASYIPVMITTNNYEQKEYEKDGLFSLEIDIEYSTNRVRQAW